LTIDPCLENRQKRSAGRYLGENLPAEENIECRFGEPIVSDDRAAVEWWGSRREQGQELTLALVTVLRHYGRGNVVDHHDYNNHIERRDVPRCVYQRHYLSL